VQARSRGPATSFGVSSRRPCGAALVTAAGPDGGAAPAGAVDCAGGYAAGVGRRVTMNVPITGAGGFTLTVAITRPPAEGGWS
jgi:hypothetical protein